MNGVILLCCVATSEVEDDRGAAWVVWKEGCYVPDVTIEADSAFVLFVVLSNLIMLVQLLVFAALGRLENTFSSVKNLAHACQFYLYL